MLNVSITIRGDKQAIANLKKLGQSMSQFDSAMKDIGGQTSKYFAGQVFASRGAVLGQQWAPLNAGYKKWKAANYPGRGQNIQTGETQRSFRFTANSTSVTIDNANKEVFSYLQLGTRKMPARPMIGVNGDVKTIIRKVIEADIDRKIQRAGL